MKKNLRSRSRDIVLLKEPDYLVDFDRRLNMVSSRMMIDITYYTLHSSKVVIYAVGGGSVEEFAY